MGFLDKVKATAQQAAEKAQEGVKTGQQKIQEAREKRSSDAALRDLGAALYLDRTGRGTPQLSSEIERLMAELRDIEESGTVIEPPVASPAPAPEPSPAPAPEPAAATGGTVPGGTVAGDAVPGGNLAAGPGPTAAAPADVPPAPSSPPPAAPVPPAADFNLDDV